MEVRDVLAMRKEGRVADAYQAINDIYASHQGPYTNLCMFLCASDMEKLEAMNKQTKVAKLLLWKMVKLYPTIDDNQGKAARAISKAALTLDRMLKDFNLIYFMPWFSKLTTDDWNDYIHNDHRVPSLCQQIVNHLLKDIPHRNIDYISKVLPMFQKAMSINPNYKENLRHYAQIQNFLGNRDKAVETYRHLLQRYHDSYLYADLADIVTDKSKKVILFCCAIVNQRTEKFCSLYHFRLALLLKDTLPHNAAYEIIRCMTIRKKNDFQITPIIQQTFDSLHDVQPVSEIDEQALYTRSMNVPI